jgi:hypothetical protein
MQRKVSSIAPSIRPRAARLLLPAAALAVILTSAGVAALAAAEPIAAAPRTTGTFDQLKALQGTWKGSNGKGHEEAVTFRLIANGGVLQQDTQAGDDPTGKGRMSTMYQIDGDRLLATHYCNTGTTPRLLATGFDDAAHTVTFSYLDGVNLASRDHGHMDKMVLHLVDANHFTTRWTWYEDGKESWLDEIRYERAH